LQDLAYNEWMMMTFTHTNAYLHIQYMHKLRYGFTAIGHQQTGGGATHKFIRRQYENIQVQQLRAIYREQADSQ